MDYAAWTSRVSRCLRSLTWLPGEIEVTDAIEPPAIDAHTRNWLSIESCSLPEEIKTFVATASNRCVFRYRWKPPDALQAKIGTLFPGALELTGGADLCDANGYRVYDQRSWFHEELPALLKQAEARFAGLLPSEHLAGTPDRTSNPFLKALDAVGAEKAHGRIALLTLDGGDQILLEVEPTEGKRPVVYVSASDPGRRHVLSKSFDQFLSDWEQLCYLTPSLTNLAHWLDPVSGFLNPHAGPTAILRELLRTTDPSSKEKTT